MSRLWNSALRGLLSERLHSGGNSLAESDRRRRPNQDAGENNWPGLFA